MSSPHLPAAPPPALLVCVTIALFAYLGAIVATVAGFAAYLAAPE